MSADARRRLRAALRGRGAGAVRVPRVPHRRSRARRGPARGQLRAGAALAPSLRPSPRLGQDLALHDRAEPPARPRAPRRRRGAGARARGPGAARPVEHRDVVQRALTALSPEEREAIALRFGAELTVPEIAEALGEPLTTVEGRVYRALRKLRAELD